MYTIYHNTARARELASLERPRAGSWLSLVAPTNEELIEFAEKYKLDADLLNDATDIYEAPRIETDEGNVYIYARYCHPEGKEIATEPLLIIYTPDYLITITRIESDIFDRILANRVEIITTQKTKALMQILSEVNFSYRSHLNKISKQTLRLRAQLRQSQVANRDFVSMIEVEEDLNEFLTALQPQASMLAVLVGGRYLRLYEEDRDMVEDLTLSTAELIELTKSRLRGLANIRQAYDTIATNNLNQTFKRLTSIAIFLTIPTIVGGLWGMNVAVPLHDYRHAFSVVIVLIAGLMAGAVYLFHRKHWL